MDSDKQKLVAEKIREHLQRRLARLIGCEPEDLKNVKTGTLCHTLFLLIGESETMPGFNTAMNALVQLLGKDLLWEDREEEAETPKVVIN